VNCQLIFLVTCLSVVPEGPIGKYRYVNVYENKFGWRRKSKEDYLGY
jgi:hypothetical protein